MLSQPQLRNRSSWDQQLRNDNVPRVELWFRATERNYKISPLYFRPFYTVCTGFFTFPSFDLFDSAWKLSPRHPSPRRSPAQKTVGLLSRLCRFLDSLFFFSAFGLARWWLILAELQIDGRTAGNCDLICGITDVLFYLFYFIFFF